MRFLNSSMRLNRNIVIPVLNTCFLLYLLIRFFLKLHFEQVEKGTNKNFKSDKLFL